MDDNNIDNNNDNFLESGVLQAGEETVLDSSKLKFDENDQAKLEEERIQLPPRLELMTDELKKIEPKALLFNAHFEGLITKAIQKLPLASTNGLIITGRPGIGKNI